MKNNHLLLLLVLVLSPLISLANDCSSINLIMAEDSPFSKIPVYNQGKVNICYAYSAAQMADYHLIKQGSAERSVHPFWVALNYAQLMKRDNIQIGHPKEALEALSRASNCDYQTIDKILNMMGSLETSTSRLMDIVKDVCTANQRSKLSLPTAKRMNFRTLNSNEAYASFIMNRLNEVDSPLSIAYCSNIWKDSKFGGISFNSRGERDVLPKGCQYHESLVVGKKQIGGSCHFLVRNTWGTKWTSYNKNWNCLCRNKKTGALSDDCSYETHGEDFSVEACWLPMDQLSKNIGQVTALDL